MGQSHSRNVEVPQILNHKQVGKMLRTKSVRFIRGVRGVVGRHPIKFVILGCTILGVVTTVVVALAVPTVGAAITTTAEAAIALAEIQIANAVSFVCKGICDLVTAVSAWLGVSQTAGAVAVGAGGVGALGVAVCATWWVSTRVRVWMQDKNGKMQEQGIELRFRAPGVDPDGANLPVGVFLRLQDRSDEDESDKVRVLQMMLAQSLEDIEEAQSQGLKIYGKEEECVCEREEQERSVIYRHAGTGDGHYTMCTSCHLDWFTITITRHLQGQIRLGHMTRDTMLTSDYVRNFIERDGMMCPQCHAMSNKVYIDSSVRNDADAELDDILRQRRH
eukprot:m.165436 g.165436  ORF g.165436 m.165436 type:complete len:333 (+) comp12561_c0_seq1:84-1082(+)